MSAAAADRSERILLVAPMGRDGALTRAVLGDAGLRAEVCPDIEALCREFESGAGALLVAEEALQQGPGAAECLSTVLGQQPPWSDIPLLIFLRAGDVTQARVPLLRWIEPLRNATFLERPVRITTLVSTLRVALAARRRQYEVRDHLIERERSAAQMEQVNRRLQEADRRKDQFLALLGHELRNPLAAISNGVQLLAADGAHPPERTARLTELINRQLRHLTRLVDDLLDVSRVTAGKIALKRQPVELNEILERCRQAVAEAAEAQQHTLRLRPAAGPLWTDGDPVRLEQVVTNLLTNAIKYTPCGGTVELLLDADAERSQAVVRVRDNGMGIAPEVLPDLFQLFSQAPQTLDRAQGGLGIGLTLVRSLVEMHGGAVAAHSEGLGRGSEFTVRLPLRPAPADAVTSRSRIDSGPRAQAPHGTGRRIVLIEDNPDISETMHEILQSLGHEVAVAQNGAEGIEQILALRPDAALVDIGLPGIDGYEVARQVRAALGPGVLLVAMTGYGQPEDRRRSQAAGFDAHLTKPPKISALEHLLARART